MKGLSNAVFREAPVVEAPKQAPPEPEVNKEHVVSGETDIEPIEVREEGGGSVVLDALNITDKLQVLPEDDKGKVADVKDYVLKIVKQRGLSPTVGAFKKTLDSIKGDMELDSEADPAIVLDRIAGVVRAYRNLSFITDPSDKRRIFMRLAKMGSSSEMNKEVYKIMNEYEVWV
jgi:hypothetical protein